MCHGQGGFLSSTSDCSEGDVRLTNFIPSLYNDLKSQITHKRDFSTVSSTYSALAVLVHVSVSHVFMQHCSENVNRELRGSLTFITRGEETNQDTIN